MNLINWLQGKKTYIIAVAGLFYVIIDGIQTGNWDMEKILAVLGLFTLRAAVTKSAPKAEQ